MEALSHPPAPLRGRAMRDFGGAGELEASSASSLTGFSSRTGRGSEAGSGRGDLLPRRLLPRRRSSLLQLH
jgi:hypothetical protein